MQSALPRLAFRLVLIVLLIAGNLWLALWLRDFAAEMAARIPDAEHFLLRAATHAAPVEHPLAIQLRVDKFLRERVAAPTARSAPTLGTP